MVHRSVLSTVRVGIALGALLASSTVAIPAATAAAAHVTPAVGTSPTYRVAGSVAQAPTFGCQVTVPAGCYGPTQIQAAYGFDKLYKLGVKGTGRVITIIDAYQSPTIAHDLALFDSVFELPDPAFSVIAPDGLTPFDQSDPNQVSWAGEITLDVEWAHAVAPGAAINLVLAKSNSDADILSAQRYVVSHNLGDVISQSFGEAEQCEAPAVQQAQHALFVQARSQGQTVLASSGDQGAAQYTCDGLSFFKAVSTPASDPNVTGVGGTILDADGVTGAYHGETAWNEPQFNAASGGGYSVLYSTPGYQRPLRLPTRGVPDISYNAAIAGGVLTVWSSSGQGADLVFIFGGTSAGSPQWAGLIALTDQLRHRRVGFINDELYTLARSPVVYNAVLHDVTTGDNTYHGEAVTVPGYPAAPGWDPATGLGTPKANVLVPALAVLP